MEKGEKLFRKKLVGSLEVVIRMLEDPKWREKAQGVSSVDELRQILIDFCRAKGEVVLVDESTLWVNVRTQVDDGTLFKTSKSY